MATKTKEEIQAYLRKTGLYSWNGVLDDSVFGENDEWYCTLNDTDTEFSGPFKTYEEAEASFRTTPLWQKILSKFK